MILTSNRSVLTVAFAFLIAIASFIPIHGAEAQRALSLAVTPTLFEMSANPTQVWKSSVKVINSNNYPITIFASAVNFAPQGEEGMGKLLPVFEEVTEGTTLAEWIEISPEAVEVPAETSKEIPFVVSVPEDASPGGHFAAILISTKPPENESKFAVSTTQVVTSLFFVRIAGDVKESGAIRSFATTKAFSQIPKAAFELRFENKGNVHLQPRGDIVIYNMWGSERGKIPINHQTHFGNVLPNSIRKFEFTWTGERSFADFGRYKAVASLGYGLNTKQFTSRATYFWVVPVKPILITLAIMMGLFFFISWAIKAYVRRMLQLSGVALDAGGQIRSASVSQLDSRRDIRISTYKKVSAPVRSGFSDLKSRLENTKELLSTLRVLASFVLAYRVFFVSVVVTLITAILIFRFFADATTEDKAYDVTIENPGSRVELSAEEVIYEELATPAGLPSISSNTETDFTVAIINTSGVPGTAAIVARDLGVAGFTVTKLAADVERLNKKSVIVFDVAVQKEAVRISKALGGALLSARTGTSTVEQANITVFVGSDQVSE